MTHSSGKKQNQQLLIDKNGVGVWTSRFTWMLVESRMDLERLYESVNVPIMHLFASAHTHTHTVFFICQLFMPQIWTGSGKKKCRYVILSLSFSLFPPLFSPYSFLSPFPSPLCSFPVTGIPSPKLGFGSTVSSPGGACGVSPTKGFWCILSYKSLNHALCHIAIAEIFR